MGDRKLVVVGAGPKAIALAAKAQVLRSLGIEVPTIHIIEKKGVGAHWTGEGGYTNGRLRLGTSPEKDLGFPYQSSCWGLGLDVQVNERMQSFSWHHYLMSQGRYADWIDRNRPPARHGEWGHYLQWAAERAQGGAFFHLGEVTQVGIAGEEWKVKFQSRSGDSEELRCEGLVMTGPGVLRLPPGVGPHPRVLTLENFWRMEKEICQRPSTHVVVAGGGESAASVVLALGEASLHSLKVSIVTSLATTYSRGESYQENRAYSDPEASGWASWSLEEKRHFLYRTERGVFSQYAQSVLDGAHQVEVVPGRVIGTRGRPEGREEGLTVQIERHAHHTSLDCDFLVVAGGFDPLALTRSLLHPDTERELLARSGLSALRAETVEPHIDFSLALGSSRPRLHLPNLAAVAQGPGFPILSCLGRLSDRILSAYVPKKGEKEGSKS